MDGPSGAGENGSASGNTGRNNDWTECKSPDVALNQVPSEDLHRLIVTGEAGSGKTTFMEMTHALHNWPGSQTLAFLLDVVELPKDPREFLPRTLVDHLRRARGNEPAVMPDDGDFERLLVRFQRKGRIILLLDALDQCADPDKIDTLKRLLNDPSWRRCRIILGSRPYPLLTQRKAGRQGLFADDLASPWRFAEPLPFDKP